MADDPNEDSPPDLRVFISYRREDTPGYAGRVYDSLAERFGEDRVFMDIDTIRPGRKFTEVITEALAESDVLLALIGRTWLTRTDLDGRRRLDNPDDPVRLELAAGLRRRIPIIPLLLQDADMPARDQLPTALAQLATWQAFELSDRRWRADIRGLIDELDRLAREKTHPHRGRIPQVISSATWSDGTGSTASWAAVGPTAPSSPWSIERLTPPPDESSRSRCSLRRCRTTMRFGSGSCGRPRSSPSSASRTSSPSTNSATSAADCSWTCN
jgi:hypothetical protein